MPNRIDKIHGVKIGFLPTRRVIFSREAAGAAKREAEAWMTAEGYDYVNLDFLNDEGLIYNGLDAAKVVERFAAEKVDAVFAMHCNFGTEDAVAKVAAKLGLPVLLWGPRDAAPDESGYRLQDTQCGLFATSKVLSRFGVKFNYITNSRLTDGVFKRGFECFVSAAAVVKAFRKLRIGQIGPRPQAFWSVIMNEGELLEKFKIEIAPLTITELAERANGLLKDGGAELKETADGIRERVGQVAFDDGTLKRHAALKLAINGWAREQELSAVSIQCWSALQTALGVAPCFINGELTGEGLPVICETDIHGAVSSVMAQAAARGASATFLADLTVRHPDNDGAELLWHCGNFPHCLHKNDSFNAFNEHFDMRLSGAGDYELKRGDVTLCRFDGLNGGYSLLFGHGRAVSGPKNKGTYLWMEVNDWPLWEEKFIYGPYIHHCAGVYGSHAAALYEACKYIPGLEPDPVDPDEAAIKKYLRG